jgi:hypothetical protein
MSVSSPKEGQVSKLVPSHLASGGTTPPVGPVHQVSDLDSPNLEFRCRIRAWDGKTMTCRNITLAELAAIPLGDFTHVVDHVRRIFMFKRADGEIIQLNRFLAGLGKVGYPIVRTIQDRPGVPILRTILAKLVGNVSIESDFFTRIYVVRDAHQETAEYWHFVQTGRLLNPQTKMIEPTVQWPYHLSWLRIEPILDMPGVDAMGADPSKNGE